MNNHRKYDSEHNSKSFNRTNKRLNIREDKKALSRMVRRAKGKFLDEEGGFNEFFLIKNHDILDWNKVSKTQKISKEFIVKFSKKINWTLLVENPNINFDLEFVEEFAEFINWRTLEKKDKITLEMRLKLGDIIEERLQVMSSKNFEMVSGTCFTYYTEEE